MAEGTFRRKTRSASICAPGFSSMEQMLGTIPPSGAKERDKSDRERDSGSGTPDSNTPTRRRRPATRSQSARVSGASKSIRRRAAQAADQHHLHHHEGSVKSPHCSSEPKLTNADVSPACRRRGSRRGQSMHHAQQKKSNDFLDVPVASMQLSPREGEDEDSYRLRSFSLTRKGVINRGDSFKRRRSRSNSLAPAEQETEETNTMPPKEVISYNVAILGARRVGKTGLISQFMTSECINAYDRQRDVPSEQSVFVKLDGEESELIFLNIPNPKTELEKIPPPDAFVVMYSVIDKASFQRAEQYLAYLRDQDLGKPVILVGNKVDLARSRVVPYSDGKDKACKYRAKFIEVSVGIKHNVDELLVGILKQIRLKIDQGQLENQSGGNTASEGSGGHWYNKSGVVVRASMKAKQMLNSLFRRDDSKFKNCEDLHVL